MENIHETKEVDDNLININIEDTKTKIEPRGSFTEKYIWRCCSGSNVDRRVLSFGVQVIVSMVTLIYAIFSLTAGEGGCFEEGILMLILGFYIPNPRLKD